MIGQGAFGKVYYCSLLKGEGKVAVKVIPLGDIDYDLVNSDFMKEIELLNKIVSPNIMKIIEYVVQKQTLIIVCEFIEGQELLTIPEHSIVLPERQCMAFMKKVFTGVSHMHSLNIIHRDLKLENIIFKKDEATGDIEDVKICDLGLSCHPEAFFQGLAGTYHYLPPEVFRKQPYNTKLDVWSLGVLVWILLFNDFPFDSDSDSELINKIKNDQPDYRMCKNLSENMIDFLKKIFEKDPVKRIDIKQCLGHPAFADVEDDIPKLPQNLFTPEKLNERIGRYMNDNKLMKSVKLFSIKIKVNKNELNKLKETFLKNDRNFDGYLDLSEFTKIMVDSYNTKISQEQINEIFRTIDVNGDNKINYDEFVAGLEKKSKLIDVMNVEYLFDIIDSDDNMQITATELKAFITSNKVEFNGKDIADIINELDSSGDKKISLEELKSWVFDSVKTD